MDQMDGIGLLKELAESLAGLKVIILTAHGTIPDAVQATQMGAFGFLTKPATAGTAGQVRKALRISGFGALRRRLARRDRHAQLVMEREARAGSHGGRHRCAACSSPVRAARQGLLARAIHRASPQSTSLCRHQLLRDGENCSSPSSSATRRVRSRARRARIAACSSGRWRHASCSTRSATCRRGLQVKLLRVLQENVIRPVGSTDAIAVNVRVISARIAIYSSS